MQMNVCSLENTSVFTFVSVTSMVVIFVSYMSCLHLSCWCAGCSTCIQWWIRQGIKALQFQHKHW